MENYIPLALGYLQSQSCTTQQAASQPVTTTQWIIIVSVATVVRAVIAWLTRDNY